MEHQLSQSYLTKLVGNRIWLQIEAEIQFADSTDSMQVWNIERAIDGARAQEGGQQTDWFWISKQISKSNDDCFISLTVFESSFLVNQSVI